MESLKASEEQTKQAILQKQKEQVKQALSLKKQQKSVKKLLADIPTRKYPKDNIGAWMAELNMDIICQNTWRIVRETYSLQVTRAMCPLRYNVIYKSEEGKIHAMITKNILHNVLNIIKEDVVRLNAMLEDEETTEHTI